VQDWLGADDSSDIGFEEIYERCRPLVERICKSRLSGLPRADIEDAIQETFVQLAAADRSRIVNVDAWLITVATRVCAHTLRERYRSREVSQPDPALPSSLDEVSAEADERLWLAKVAALLPTVDRQLLHLLYVQDLPYGEIAEYFDISNGHARLLAYRARQHARGIIHDLE